ncbi:hypothetical protein BKA69DRAFT_1080284 [Paraphysoderma sedebokerense]|nr:hypothetical protein BKA69DRAFT_1080284 [Paraphysoderma sedebokerense]
MSDAAPPTSEQPPEYLYDASKIASISANTGLGFIIAVAAITFLQSPNRQLKLLSLTFMVESILYFTSFHFMNSTELLLLPIFSFLLEICTASGYSIMNYSRLRFFIKKKYDIRIIRFLDFLCLGDLLWSIYSLYDAAFNLLVSIRFAMFLRTLPNPAMKKVVKRCLYLLFFECAFTIIASGLSLSQVDENFTSTYVAVAKILLQE